MHPYISSQPNVTAWESHLKQEIPLLGRELELLDSILPCTTCIRVKKMYYNKL